MSIKHLIAIKVKLVNIYLLKLVKKEKNRLNLRFYQLTLSCPNVSSQHILLEQSIADPGLDQG
jgi:hypothetical protein